MHARPDAPKGYRLRAGEVADAPRLREIELAAAELFPVEDLPPALAEDATPAEEFEQAAREGELLVATREPDHDAVGFARIEANPPVALLGELDVHPDHARKGLGAFLLEAALAHARSHGCAAVTLTTFDHLPWNAPFYARHGFRVLARDELDPRLAGLLEAEAAAGLDPARRVAMRCELASDPGPGQQG